MCRGIVQNHYKLPWIVGSEPEDLLEKYHDLFLDCGLGYVVNVIEVGLVAAHCAHERAAFVASALHGQCDAAVGPGFLLDI